MESSVSIYWQQQHFPLSESNFPHYHHCCVLKGKTYFYKKSYSPKCMLWIFKSGNFSQSVVWSLKSCLPTSSFLVVPWIFPLRIRGKRRHSMRKLFLFYALKNFQVVRNSYGWAAIRNVNLWKMLSEFGVKPGFGPKSGRTECRVLCVPHSLCVCPNDQADTVTITAVSQILVPCTKCGIVSDVIMPWQTTLRWPIWGQIDSGLGPYTVCSAHSATLRIIEMLVVAVSDLPLSLVCITQSIGT